jgi:starch synthase
MSAVKLGTRNGLLSRGQGPVRRVWMLSYECAGIAQAGGLGEAVSGLARTLATDYNLKVTVLLPSHGRHLDPGLRESYQLKEENRFIAQGYRIGTNGVHYGFLSGIENGNSGGVEFVLVKGLDAVTSHWLDDPVLYAHDLTFEKMALFARTVKLYSEFLWSMRRENELPDLIHANDWHMVPAGVAVKQNLQERGLAIPLVFTVHLLSYVSLPWHYASEEWCGIKDSQHQIRSARKRPQKLTYRQVWEGQSKNSLEKFGGHEADYVTSVSKSYLTDDVFDYVGPVIKGKSGYIYNGCNWDYEQITSTIFAQEKPRFVGPEPEQPVSRWDLRSSLLTSAIGQVVDEFPTDGDTVAATEQGKGQTTVTPFKGDGPLVLMTGRLSHQKGADLLLDAVPSVTKTIPGARFLLFLLPSGDRDQMRTLKSEASAYPENVRIIFAQHRQAYLMSHIAADVYAMPSRSEPFGISALEAMVTGNPVVGSRIGGIGETVLDITKHGDKGTGLLVPPENAKSLAESLISLLFVMQIDEWTQRGQTGSGKFKSKIPISHLSQLVSQNKSVGSKIRENCKSRVEQHFRWRNAGRTAVDRYTAAMKIAASSFNRGISFRKKPLEYGVDSSRTR